MLIYDFWCSSLVDIVKGSFYGDGEKKKGHGLFWGIRKNMHAWNNLIYFGMQCWLQPHALTYCVIQLQSLRGIWCHHLPFLALSSLLTNQYPLDVSIMIFKGHVLKLHDKEGFHLRYPDLPLSNECNGTAIGQMTDLDLADDHIDFCSQVDESRPYNQMSALDLSPCLNQLHWARPHWANINARVRY